MTIEMTDKWTTLFPTIPRPPDLQFTIWAMQHSPEIVQQGLVLAAVKNLRLTSPMDQDYAVRFASSIMNRLTNTPIGAL